MGNDNVDLVQAGSFTSSKPGINVPVIAADSLSGAAASNYTLTQPTGLHANIDVTGTQSYRSALSSVTAASGSAGASSGSASASTSSGTLLSPAPAATANRSSQAGEASANTSSPAAMKFDVDGLSLTVITSDDNSLLDVTLH